MGDVCLSRDTGSFCSRRVSAGGFEWIGCTTPDLVGDRFAGEKPRSRASEEVEVANECQHNTLLPKSIAKRLNLTDQMRVLKERKRGNAKPHSQTHACTTRRNRLSQMTPGRSPGAMQNRQQRPEWGKVEETQKSATVDPSKRSHDR